MGTLVFECGCSITSSMFGEREILSVFHCPDHRYLFSQDKTLREMAKEIRAVVVTLL
jgi:hypothetical protein